MNAKEMNRKQKERKTSPAAIPMLLIKPAILVQSLFPGCLCPLLPGCLNNQNTFSDSELQDNLNRIDQNIDNHQLYVDAHKDFMNFFTASKEQLQSNSSQTGELDELESRLKTVQVREKYRTSNFRS